VEPSEARRWIANFEAVATVDRDELRRRGPDSSRAIQLALSLIEAARQGGIALGEIDPVRRSQDETVRSVWVRLRAHAAR
jgi:hypothetical protein